MPLASIHEPAYLIHNNLPIYHMYRNDWYDDPYHYHFSVMLYPDNEIIETFDIRDLPGYHPDLSAAEIIRHAIDEKTLPIFQLSEEEQRGYMLDDTIGYVKTTDEQDACFELGDSLLTKLFHASSQDAFCIRSDSNMFSKTLFLVPDADSEIHSGRYQLSIYSDKASWEDFRKHEPLKSLTIDTSYHATFFRAICEAMDIPYPEPEKEKEPLTSKIQEASKKQQNSFRDSLQTDISIEPGL